MLLEQRLELPPQVRLLFYEVSFVLNDSLAFLGIFRTGERDPQSAPFGTQAHDLALQSAELRRVFLFEVTDVVEVLPDVVVVFDVASEAASDFLNVRPVRIAYGALVREVPV